MLAHRSVVIHVLFGLMGAFTADIVTQSGGCGGMEETPAWSMRGETRHGVHDKVLTATRQKQIGLYCLFDYDKPGKAQNTLIKAIDELIALYARTT